jgi:drug/metabolite transporter (DMT)-like permease
VSAARCGRMMDSQRNLRPKTYLLLFLEVSFGALGNTLFDKGMKEIGALGFSSGAEIWAGALRTFTNGTIWIGVLFMLLFIVCHMLVLSWADYSFVMPFSAVSYALVPLFAFLWLGEKVLTTRWVGIGFIVIGVILVSRTPPSTTLPALDEPHAERG